MKKAANEFFAKSKEDICAEIRCNGIAMKAWCCGVGEGGADELTKFSVRWPHLS